MQASEDSQIRDDRSIELNGQRLAVEEHPTDFSIFGSSESVHRAVEAETVSTTPLSTNMTRVRAASPEDRSELLSASQQETVSHPIYRLRETREELVVDDRLFLTLRNEDSETLDQLVDEHRLEPQDRVGSAHVLRLTDGRNPLCSANAISQQAGVVSCTPQLLLPIQTCSLFGDNRQLLAQQWHLGAESLTHPDLDPSAGINAREAWQISTGSQDVVIAVIDDDFQFDHPALEGCRIHSAARDYAVPPTSSGSSSGRQPHGTSVASLAVARSSGSGLVGVAPGVTLLPIRIGYGPMAPQTDLLEIFRYVSQYADVVNCSFSTPPSSYDPIHPQVRSEITELSRSGGRRGKGLVMVFAAGNDDSPTYLRGEKNTQGISFVRRHSDGTSELAQIPAGQDVYSGFPMTPGVVVAGAVTSLKKKSGYSNWGQHITVVAPSSNFHSVARLKSEESSTEEVRSFVTSYRGLSLVAASGSVSGSNGTSSDSTEGRGGFQVSDDFGGTSGAAPIVSGVAGLMLSVNPELSAAQVKQILEATADRDLDPSLDLAEDRNLNGISGAFVGSRSPYFGSGKVNALRAVRRALALADSQISFSPYTETSTSPSVGYLQAPSSLAVLQTPSGLSDLHIESFPWESRGSSGPIGRWPISISEELRSGSIEARAFAIGPDGTFRSELQLFESSGSAAESQPSGTFSIRSSQPVQGSQSAIGQSTNRIYRELVVRDPGFLSEPGSRILVILRSVSEPTSVTETGSFSSERRPESVTPQGSRSSSPQLSSLIRGQSPFHA